MYSLIPTQVTNRNEYTSSLSPPVQSDIANLHRFNTHDRHTAVIKAGKPSRMSLCNVNQPPMDPSTAADATPLPRCRPAPNLRCTPSTQTK